MNDPEIDEYPVQDPEINEEDFFSGAFNGEILRSVLIQEYIR
jgi:hypothetical protein